MFHVLLQDFPRNSEFNLGRLGILRAKRDTNTLEPYVECVSQEQVDVLRRRGLSVLPRVSEFFFKENADLGLTLGAAANVSIQG